MKYETTVIFFVELAFSVTYSCLTPKVNGVKTNAK